MSALKPAPVPPSPAVEDDDPVERAFRDAPVDERPLSDEEATALREAREAGGPFVSHAEAMAAVRARFNVE